MTSKNSFLRECPGTTGDLARAIDATFCVTDPILSLSIAFSVAGAMRAGRIKHDWCHANAYHCLVALTGTGKTTAHNYGLKAIIDAGLADMLCGDFTSEAALIYRLSTDPVTYANFDEIGLALQNMAEDKGGNRRDVFQCMLRAYTSTTSVLLGKRYSPMGGKAITLLAEKPLLSIFGSTTPGAFFAGMTSRAAADGLLGRFLVWFGGNTDPKAPERKRIPFVTPDSVAKEYSEFAGWPKEINRPEVLEIKIEDLKTFNIIGDDFDRNTRLETNETKRSLIARGREVFIKTCLAITPSSTNLDLPSIIYAQELVSYLHREAWAQCEDALGRSKRGDEHLQNVEKFLAKIPTGVDRAISRTELSNRVKRLGLKKSERNDILQELIDSGLVVDQEKNVNEYDSRTTTFYWRS